MQDGELIYSLRGPEEAGPRRRCHLIQIPRPAQVRALASVGARQNPVCQGQGKAKARAGAPRPAPSRTRQIPVRVPTGAH